ncbi:YqaA family protein [Leptospira sarikeiensis]|uniref:DedA family protein n=1 Tax=Leptospira sarikeiensis TaxID=2484943 RepID=A0A4R9KDV9_9LEPT|nr:VTT domain-containing protein [Leptospira sarikeiensis]TGL64491.1 DedA family protein [Leptospira sarikeiensis]
MKAESQKLQDSTENLLSSLLKQTLIASVLLLIFVLVLARFFNERVTQIAGIFLDYTGVYGVGLSILVADSVHVFFPPDTFLILAVAAKMEDFWVIFFASLGSLVAGACSYAQGKYLLPKLNTFTKFMRNHEEKLEVYVKRFGFWAVVLAALTPLPYSWTSVAAGAMKMRFGLFFAAALFRIPRFIIYYYLIKGGWIGI